ncbi:MULTISPECIES: NAD-dependent epimerase/dehydratase family protein [Streptomyces]|nr:NAD-dependent epimerase/dehydratase [Streptomyces nigrescens]MEE4424139.1 NAD-dependent epimerase/dehydratase [Streptomyces sp. DSM 41528]
MEIIGNGFLARHLAPLRAAYPQVSVVAAGVPRHHLPDSAHEREAALVRDVVRACRSGGRTLVFLSTVSMYGGPGCRGREDDPVVPSTRYGRHKYELEGVVRASGVDHLILRLAYVMGPYGPDFRLLPALIRQIRSGRVDVHRGARRDMLHVADFVILFERLLRAGIRNEVVNVASGDCADIAQVIDYVERCLGVVAEHRIVEAQALSYCASVAKLKRLVPEAWDLRFGPGYHRLAIERYLRETGQWAAVPGPAG